MFRILERRRANPEGAVDGQTIRNALVHSLRINLPNRFGLLFMDVFAPDYDSNLVHKRSKPRFGQRGKWGENKAFTDSRAAA
jgi:hypothetical protein